MDLDLASILFVTAFALFIVFGWWGQLRGTRATLDQWAAREGYTMLLVERRFVHLGPFAWRTLRNQEVFYVKVRDKQGCTRIAYVRVGHWLLGFMSEKVAVKWMD